MATGPEMSGLWGNGIQGVDPAGYEATEIAGSFAPSWSNAHATVWIGRYDEEGDAGYHMTLLIGENHNPPTPLMKDPWPGYQDTDDAPTLEAWVTTDASVVPAPGALVLAATGLLSSTLGLKRLRRKRQE